MGLSHLHTPLLSKFIWFVVSVPDRTYKTARDTVMAGFLPPRSTPCPEKQGSFSEVRVRPREDIAAGKPWREPRALEPEQTEAISGWSKSLPETYPIPLDLEPSGSNSIEHTDCLVAKDLAKVTQIGCWLQQPGDLDS